MEVDSPPPSWRELQEHLNKLATAPDETKLDVKLLEIFQAQLTELAVHDLLPTILPLLLNALQVVQQDPAPITTLILRLLRSVPFTACLTFATPASLIQALSINTPPSVRLLAISIVGKATASSSDAAIVAGMKDVIIALIYTWLHSPETEVGQGAEDLLGSLLEVDNPKGSTTNPDGRFGDIIGSATGDGGQGLMWRRIFQDKEVYSLLYTTCSLKTAGDGEGQLNARHKTIAQARLLGLVTKMASLNFPALSTSWFSDVESEFCSGGAGGARLSLLDFAAVHMVDAKGDILMHITLLDFFKNLLLTAGKIVASNEMGKSSAQLEFLNTRGLHHHAMTYYLDSDAPGMDPLDASLLGSSSAAYLAAYASSHPSHILTAKLGSGADFIDAVLTRVKSNLEARSVRAGNTVPTADLNVLISLPRIALLPPNLRTDRPRTSSAPPSPLDFLFIEPPKPEYIRALAIIFHGPEPELLVNGSLEVRKHWHDDAAAARQAYCYFANRLATANRDTSQPLKGMWLPLGRYIDIVALKDVALASLEFLASMVTSIWVIPSGDNAGNPEDNRYTKYPAVFRSQLSGLLRDFDSQDRSSATLENAQTWSIHHFPPSGFIALLENLAYHDENNPATTVVSPPTTYSNLVGGRGDAEGAAYKIAMARFDVVTLMKKQMEKLSEKDFDDTLRLSGVPNTTLVRNMIRQRYEAGPWGGTVSGPRIDALEL